MKLNRQLNIHLRVNSAERKINQLRKAAEKAQQAFEKATQSFIQLNKKMKECNEITINLTILPDTKKWWQFWRIR